MSGPSARRGFSLTEILVAFTVLAILGAMLTRFLVAQSRFTEHQNAVRSARMVSRQALNILESELRMVQDSGGLEVAANNGKTITALVPYRFGLVCGTVGLVTVVSMLPVDSLSLAQVRHAGYAWRSKTGIFTYVHTGNEAPSPATLLASQCTGTLPVQAGIRTLTLNGRQGQLQQIEPAAPTAPIGQPIFFFQRITYEFKASLRFPGTVGLFRAVQNGPNEELLGPFDSTARFKYWVAGATASSASAPAVGSIRGVDVVLAARSTGTPATKSAPARSEVVATIFFRNVRRN